jgi:SAM-dependent methyltransferase
MSTRSRLRQSPAPVARRADHVAVDWTKCFGYEQLLAEELEVYSALEVTEQLKEGGIAANPAWEGWYRFLAATWGTDFGSEIVAAARPFDAPRVLSLGCGHGGFELDVARRVGPECRILALDLNESLFGRAREEVAREGLDVTFQSIDLNFVELEPESFDVVFAHASLHHILNFEHLFSQVHRALVDRGSLVVLDIIGKTQVLFWPENVRFATELVAAMPERYRGDVTVDSRALFPGYIDGAAQSGMEGIRQEELEVQLERWFRPRRSFKYNSFVRLICTHPDLVRGFDPELTEDRDYLEGLYRLDLAQIAGGALRPTELFAVYEKRAESEVPPRLPPADAAGAPSVSVVVTCDGSVEELRACVASVAAQTHRPREVLLLDVGGGVDMAETARSLAASLPTGRWLPVVETLDRAGGIDWERVVGATRGELVALASGRDAWYPIKLAEQVALLQRHPGAGLAYAQALLVDERGRRTAGRLGSDVVGDAPGAVGSPRATHEQVVPRSSLVFRRESWHALERPEGADGDPGRRLLEHGCPCVFDPRPLGMVRAGAEGPSHEDAGPPPTAQTPGAPAAPRSGASAETRAIPRSFLGRIVRRLRGGAPP